MTNFERLKNLTLNEILEELNFPLEMFDSSVLGKVIIPLVDCFNDCPVCRSNGSDVCPSCEEICVTWLDKESADDANYGADRRWRDFCEEQPPELGHPNEYNVVVNKCELATVLTWNGFEWYDEDHNTYNVKWWMPIPEAPKFQR